MNLKQQHEELDQETNQKIIDLNTAQKKKIILRGETRDGWRVKELPCLLRNSSVVIFNFMDPTVLIPYAL
jgi:hypothetical protein